MRKMTNEELGNYIQGNGLLFALLYGITNEEIEDPYISGHWERAEGALFELKEALKRAKIISEMEEV